MITLLNKQSLFSTFNIENFDSLNEVIYNMSPSMVEYYLSDLCAYDDNIYLNKKNIEKSISIGEYSLYYDYDDNIYLEADDTNLIDNDTGTLW